jgi:hypothetical protein
MLQTTAQQLSLSHPGLGAPVRASKQLPTQGHRSPGRGRQTSIAVFAQLPSQPSAQHSGSIEHTPLQQAPSMQPALVCAVKQSPGAGHDSGSGQTASVASTHSASHSCVQQSGFTLQTAREQSGFEQPGVLWISRQLSVPTTQLKVRTHRKPASRAQTASQRDSQQNLSISQTSAQQVASEHPGT